MRNKSIGYISKIIIVAALLVLMPASAICFPAFATDDNVDIPDLPSASYSLRVSEDIVGDSKISFKNAKIIIYQVASVKVINRTAIYNPVTAFSGMGVDFQSMTSSESNDIAESLAEAIDSKKVNAPAIHATYNTDDEVAFDNLLPGIYLIVHANRDAEEWKSFEMDPFLACVPGLETQNGVTGWISNVIAYPKAMVYPEYGEGAVLSLTKKVKGKKNAKDKFSFELRAKDISNPMPLNSMDGKSQISIKGAGEAEFDDITFTEPGTFEYELSEVKGSNKSYKYDEKVYEVVFEVYYSDAEGDLGVIQKISRDGKSTDEIVFTNKYIGAFPGTGDRNDIYVLIAMAYTSAVLIIVMILHRKIVSKGRVNEK